MGFAYHLTVFSLVISVDFVPSLLCDMVRHFIYTWDIQLRASDIDRQIMDLPAVINLDSP